MAAKKKVKNPVKAKAAKTKTKMKAGEGKAELHQWTAGDYDGIAISYDRSVHTYPASYANDAKKTKGKTRRSAQKP